MLTAELTETVPPVFTADECETEFLLIEDVPQYIGERDFNDGEVRRRPGRPSLRPEFAERDRLEEAAQIVADAVAFTSGIPSHVAFDRLHDFVGQISQRSGNSFHVAELRADLWLAAMYALRNEPMLRNFYRLWTTGAADDIAPRVLARSQDWYRIRSLVGEEIRGRGLLNGYFVKRRNGRKR